MLAMCDV